MATTHFFPIDQPCCAETLTWKDRGSSSRQYLQSVKKTCAARYLAVGGSLKSPMREWTDCREEKKRELKKKMGTISELG